MKKDSLIKLCVSLGLCFLLVFYLTINIDDARSTFRNLSLFRSGHFPSHLKLLTQDGETLLKVTLRISDFFDGSGQRQLNFEYLNQLEFDTIANQLSKILIFLDGEKIPSTNLVTLNQKAIAISLPEHKLYLLAPPHMDMMAHVLTYERKLRPDIFTCSSDKAFCQSVKLERFTGLRSISEKTLEEDRPENSDLIPRGREAGRHLTLWFSSKKKQAVQIVIHMKTPIPEQSLRASVSGKILQQEHYGLSKDYDMAKLDELIYDFLKLNTLNYQLDIDALPGINRIDIEFSELSRIPAIFPVPISGIVTNIDFQRPDF